jgi:hypothetical protein
LGSLIEIAFILFVLINKQISRARSRAESDFSDDSRYFICIREPPGIGDKTGVNLDGTKYAMFIKTILGSKWSSFVGQVRFVLISGAVVKVLNLVIVGLQKSFKYLDSGSFSL